MTAAPVTIAMACDRPYLHPFAVAVTSLVRHSPHPVLLKFGLAADWQLRISPPEVEPVVALVERTGARIELVETPVAVDSLPPTLHISPTAFVKLALLDTCADGDSLVWVDADTMARGDWTSIYSASSGHAASGVHEPQSAFEDAWPATTSDWYVNTGVVAVDGTAWQREFAGRWHPYLEAYREHGFRYLDQDVLNALVRDRWNLLPQDYNFRLDHSGTWRDPTIVHFAGWWKPWLRIRRQSRLLQGAWKRAFEEYADAERHLVDIVRDGLPAADRQFWDRQRRSTRGFASSKAVRHYVRGVLHD